MERKSGMGRFIPHVLLKISALFLVTAMMFLFAGCPDPLMEIEFQKGSKRVEDLSISLVKDTLKINISGISYYNGGSNDFYLGFDFNLYCYEDCKDLIVYPDSVELFYCDKRIVNSKPDYFQTRMKKKWMVQSHGVGVIFNARECLLELDRNDAFDTNFLKLYLGNMIYFRGEKIEIDTIYAYDPKAKYFRR